MNLGECRAQAKFRVSARCGSPARISSEGEPPSPEQAFSVSAAPRLTALPILCGCLSIYSEGWGLEPVRLQSLRVVRKVTGVLPDDERRGVGRR
jgi:hypothetical protein